MTVDEAVLEVIRRRQAAVEKARTHLLSYTRLLHPDPADPADPDKTKYDTQKHHEVIATSLEEVKKGKIKRAIYVVPPRHGKTEIATKTFPGYFLGDQPHKSVLVATYSDRFAIDLGRAIRANIEHPATRQVFPELELRRDARSSGRMETTRNGFIAALGRGTAVTGRGGDLLLVDDPLKDRKEADSQTIRNSLWTWYTQVFATRLMTDQGAIIIIQTRWHEDDLVGRLTDPRNPNYNPREAKKWTVIDLPATARERDPLGRKPGQPLWPKRFGKKYLQGIQQQDPRGYAALYQGRPSPEEGTLIQEDHLVQYGPNDMPDPATLRWYMASDHAVSLDQQADKTVIGLMGVDQYGDIWVHPQLTWKRMQTDQAVEAALWLVRKHKPVMWFSEKGVIEKSIGPFLRKRMMETETYVSIRTFPTAHDKPTRAQSIIGRMALGHVKFPGFAAWWPDAKYEMLSFPYGTHDDFVDFLSLFGLGLDTLAHGQRKAVPEHLKPRGAKFGSLGWVKEQSRRQAQALRTADKQGW